MNRFRLLWRLSKTIHGKGLTCCQSYNKHSCYLPLLFHYASHDLGAKIFNPKYWHLVPFLSTEDRAVGYEIKRKRSRTAHDDSHLLQLKCLSILISPAVFPKQFGKAAKSKNKPKQRDTQSEDKFQFLDFLWQKVVIVFDVKTISTLQLVTDTIAYSLPHLCNKSRYLNVFGKLLFYLFYFLLSDRPEINNIPFTLKLLKDINVIYF